MTKHMYEAFTLVFISIVSNGCDPTGSPDDDEHELQIVLSDEFDISADEAIGQPSKEDFEAIADGPPHELYPEFNLAAAMHPTQANGWNRVCAASLTLKSAPGGAGGYLGTLYNGYWFYKTDTNGAWSAGYSNELGVWGWVLSQYLC